MQFDIVLPVFPSFRLSVPAFHLFRLSVFPAFLSFLSCCFGYFGYSCRCEKKKRKRKSVLNKSPRIFYGWLKNSPIHFAFCCSERKLKVSQNKMPTWSKCQKTSFAAVRDQQSYVCRLPDLPEFSLYVPLKKNSRSNSQKWGTMCSTGEGQSHILLPKPKDDPSVKDTNPKIHSWAHPPQNRMLGTSMKI